MRYACPTLALSLLLAACNATRPTPDPLDIGGYHRPVSTPSADAQLWFDRGLALCYGFNHEEALRCFERALDADPQLAAAHWGIAYALGPNYNQPEVEPAAVERARTALAEGLAACAAPTVSGVERELLQVLETRFGEGERAELDLAYAEAMARLLDRYPDDPDVAALAAEARMQLAPWALWAADGTPHAVTHEVRAVLEAALARWPEHPALCHLYIHAMEAGPEVRAALPAARRLERRMPGLGHLVHMPSHIYTWTGNYADVVRVNLEAVRADDAYVREYGREGMFTLYRVHDLHFVAYGAMFTGQRELALEHADRVVAELAGPLVEAMPDYLDIFLATPYHVRVRFGMWEEILSMPEPQDPLLATRAVHHYARALALAVTGQADAAAAEQARFREARAQVPESRLLFNNPVREVLAVADAVLAGEVAYFAGRPEEAYAHLREAVRLDDALNYDEPWGWMEPARHALGALLLSGGHVDEAAQVYRDDLRRYPENAWALHGLAECLGRQGDALGAADARARFERAFADATVTIPGSCYCRVP